MAENKLTGDHYDCLEPAPQLKKLVVFIPTKDRPMQFEACLYSIVKNLFNVESCDIFVLAKSSNENIRTCYEDICLDYITSGQNILLKHEKDFGPDFLDSLDYLADRYKIVLGMTDDTLAYRPLNFSFSKVLHGLMWADLFTISLRLGKNTTQQNPDDPSEKIVIPERFINYGSDCKVAEWGWKNKNLSVNCQYPISLDGHFYRTKELRNLSDLISFKNLREWEGELMAYVFRADEDEVPPLMSCLEQSYTVNVSCNLTQYPFIEKMGPYGKSLVELQQLFDAGYTVDLDSTFKDVEVSGSHQYIDLKFSKAF